MLKTTLHKIFKMMSTTPSFTLQKLVAAPRDESRPGGFHASLLSWKQLRDEPFLHVSPVEQTAVVNLVSGLREPGETISFHLHEVEYREKAIDPVHSFHLIDPWNAESRAHVERMILANQALSVSYSLDDRNPDALSVVVRKDMTRLADTIEVELQLLKPLPEPSRVPGSNVMTLEYDGGFWDYYSMVEV